VLKACLWRDACACRVTDGIHGGLRGSEDRLCALVVIGVNARGEEHFLAIDDSVREPTEALARGAARAQGPRSCSAGTGDRPLSSILRIDYQAVDGAMGVRAALVEIVPATQQ
jgi:hypothetical protein